MVSRELLDACRRGDPGAFEELLERTKRQVFSLATRLMRDPHEAEDVAQEVYLRVYRGLRGFREDARFETWLYRIVTNTAFTHLKRRGRFGDLLVEDQPPEAPSTDRPVGDLTIDRDELRRALASLTEAARVVVVLKDIYGLPVRDIAHEMGISEGAVKVRLHRARARLKAAMGEG